MLLPGFLTSEKYNYALIRFLNQQGHNACGWQQGINLGPRGQRLEGVSIHLETLAQLHDTKITLISHSLGGIFARELSKIFPDLVSQVISIGSPFGNGREDNSYPFKLFAKLNPISELPIDIY